MIDMSGYGTHLDGSEDEEDLFEDGGGLELELDNCINTEPMLSFLIMIERNKTWASFFALEYHRKNPKDNRLSKIIKTRSHYLQVLVNKHFHLLYYYALYIVTVCVLDVWPHPFFYCSCDNLLVGWFILMQF